MNPVLPPDQSSHHRKDVLAAQDLNGLLPAMQIAQLPEVKPAAVDAQPRVVVLDSLRGIAAFTVMVHHYLLTLPVVYPYGQAAAPLWSKLLQFSPLHLLWAGYEAVVLFFVLSGFVLSLPFSSGQPMSYRNFVVKRWARIWIPYVVVVTLAALSAWLFGGSQVQGTGVWFNGAWSDRSVEGYLNHALLIGDLDRFSAQFLPVVWSLRYEMLASLAFPLLLSLSRSVSWPLLLLLGAAMNIIGVQYSGTLRPFQFALMFLVGILLAQHRASLIGFFQQMPRVLHVPTLALALSLYLCSWLAWNDGKSAIEVSLIDCGITAASAFAILVALASDTARKLLSWSLMIWLGRVSYSVYLVHTLVLLVVVHTVGRWIPLWILLFLCVPLTLWVSHLTYRWVEVPAIALGRKLTSGRIQHPS